MISGAPGIGKTRTLRHYEGEHGNQAIYLSVARGEGNPSHLAAAMRAGLFMDTKRSGDDLNTQRRFLAGCIGPRRVLLVDEAQNLDQRHKFSATKGSGFGWLVALAEEGGFDLAFCGDLTLARIIAMDFPHLQSRVRRPVVIRAVARADVAALADGEGMTAPEAIAALERVATLPGGLRNVENVLRLAAIFAGAARPNLSHLMAAILDMKLAPKGER